MICWQNILPQSKATMFSNFNKVIWKENLVLQQIYYSIRNDNLSKISKSISFIWIRVVYESLIPYLFKNNITRTEQSYIKVTLSSADGEAI